MARTFRGVTLDPSNPTRHPRPQIPLPWPQFRAELGPVSAETLDDSSIIIVPYGFHLYDSSFNEWERWHEDGGIYACWKSTRCYEQIGERHARIVEFKRRDEYTAFPILAKPSGATMVAFLNRWGAWIYREPVDAPRSRVKAEYLPLVYQWALDAISGLVFVHEHDVVFGEVSTIHCWLDSDYRVSLVGFLNAGFSDMERSSTVVEGDWESGYDEWLGRRKPSKETDLVMFGYLVYELMTAYAPASRWEARHWKEDRGDVPRHQWPRLETEYMGDIVRKCWDGEYVGADKVKLDLTRFLAELRWEIDADDKLKGFDAKALLS